MVSVVGCPALDTDAPVFGAQVLLSVVSKLLVAERAGGVPLLKHVEFLAGVLHLLHQTLVVLCERLNARGDCVGVRALPLDCRSLLSERGVSLQQRGLPFPDSRQPIDARLQLGGYALPQCLSCRFEALFLPRNRLCERGVPCVKAALFRQRDVQSFEFRLRRLQRIEAGEYLRARLR